MDPPLGFFWKEICPAKTTTMTLGISETAWPGITSERRITPL
jgi:hypothetical protein